MPDSPNDEIAAALAAMTTGKQAQRPLNPFAKPRPPEPGASPPPQIAAPSPSAPQPTETQSLETPDDDDDDAVIVPEPPLLYRGPTHLPHPALPIAFYQTLAFKRTIIPILLTCSVLLMVLGLLKFVTDPTQGLQELPDWVPALAFTMAAVLIIFAVLNMLQVRHILSGQARK